MLRRKLLPLPLPPTPKLTRTLAQLNHLQRNLRKTKLLQRNLLERRLLQNSPKNEDEFYF